MTQFEKALAVVLQLEGGISDHPEDKGGLTKNGITQGTYNSWRRRHFKPVQPVTLMDDDERDTIYRQDYWQVGRCDILPWPVSLAHFDACVHHGPGTAIELLQAAIDVAVDGQLGPKTLAEITRRGPWETCFAIIQARKGYILSLDNDTFLKGWLNRIQRLSAKLIEFGE